MRTLIQGGWVVGFDGSGHELIANGVVVYEDDRIVHVGRASTARWTARSTPRGKLVSPGFVNCHLHAGSNAPQTVFMADGTRPTTSAATSSATWRRARGAQPPRAVAKRRHRRQVTACGRPCAPARRRSWTWAQPGGPEAFTKLVGELGVRAYLGPGFRSASTSSTAIASSGSWNEAQGKAGLARAIDYVQEVRRRLQRPHPRHDLPRPDGHVHGRAPARRAARRRRAERAGAVPRRDEPARVPQDPGAARQDADPAPALDRLPQGAHRVLGHCVFHNEHSWCHYPYGDDLQILADTGATVVHAPYKYAKMGIMLESFARYRARGINMAHRHRHVSARHRRTRCAWAAMMCRLADESFMVGKPRDVFDAATLGGARAPRARRPRPAGRRREGRHHRDRPAQDALRRRARPDQGAGRVRQRQRRRDRHRGRPAADRRRQGAAPGRGGAAARRAGGRRAHLACRPGLALDRQDGRRGRATELPDPEEKANAR